MTNEFENEIYSASDQIAMVVGLWHMYDKDAEDNDTYQSVHNRLDEMVSGALVLLSLKDLEDLLCDIAAKNPVKEKLLAAQAVAKQDDLRAKSLLKSNQG